MENHFNSSDLDDRLKKIVAKKEEIEKEYRQSSQKNWTILFIDVSASAKKVWDLGEKEANFILENYQQIVRATLERKQACFIEPGGGPQIVCCFENTVDGLLSAQSVLHVMKEWNKDQSEEIRLLPAIGVHKGYINFHDGVIHQSNTNNKTKRIQSEASPGQVYVSKEIQKSLANHSFFSFHHVGTFSLKNIPEPQDIYEVRFKTLEEFDAFDVAQSKEKSQGFFSSSPPRESHEWVFVYIDVCESTKKFWKFGDREASDLIQEYQKLCHTNFKQFGCSYVKSCEGDQIIAAFEIDDVNSAAVSAIKILKDLFRRNVKVAQSKQIRAAIGIHKGEVILEEDQPVTTADMRVGKAIQSLAGADEIFLSADVSQLLDFELQKYVSSYSECRFADISETYDIQSLNWIHAQLRPSLIHPRTRKKFPR